ncbi:MAG TPA: YcaO-like family protein, partial [Bacillota bacterium]|nr:YcaO-like family protein [Bacillota bacterium]
NGVALGGSPSEAALYGLLELIERDAFLLFWYRQVKLRKINSQTIGKELQEMIDNYETPHTKVHLFDMTIEIQIPTILCLVTSEDSNLASYISTATHINPYIAIKNAIDEAIVGHAIYNTNPNIGKGQYKHYTDVKEMFDHIDFASSTSAIKNYDYITTQKETYDVDDLYGDFKEEYGGLEKMDDVLKYVIQQKMYNHETIYFADLSTPFVTRYNLYSVKAIVPSMLTMSFGYGDARIHKQRLISGIVQSKDYKSKAHIVEGEYYDKPHSFP